MFVHSCWCINLFVWVNNVLNSNLIWIQIWFVLEIEKEREPSPTQSQTQPSNPAQTAAPFFSTAHYLTRAQPTSSPSLTSARPTPLPFPTPQPNSFPARPAVAKMASHAIFQYNVLAIDDTHNTWTNVMVKMTILRLLGSSDDKGRRGIARPEGPPLRGFR